MKPFKIDVHTHILPPELPDFKKLFGYEGFITTRSCGPGCGADLYHDSGAFFRKVKENCFSPEVRMKECEPFDLQVQVLSTLPIMFSYGAKPRDGLLVCQMLNDHISGIVQNYPKRFVGLGSVPLQNIELSVQEVDRCVNKLGLKGFQIGSHVEQFNLSDIRFDPFYKKCEELGAALFVHPWDMMGKDRMGKYWLPWLVGMPAETSLAICSMIFGGVFKRFPKLRVAFAHGGGSFPYNLGRVEHGFQARPDLCAIDNDVAPSDYIGHFYVDSLVHDPRAMRYLVDLLGANRICLGSDYPFPLGEFPPDKKLSELNLSDLELDDIYSGSALSWLNMRREDFI